MASASKTIVITGAIETVTRALGLHISVVTKRVYVRPVRMPEITTGDSDVMAVLVFTTAMAITAAATITAGATTRHGSRLTMMAITAVTTRV